jgi:exodeoxyribonuclease-5
MLNQFFFNEVIKNLDYEATTDQKKVLSAFTEFFFTINERIFILNGYAGSGKTTVIKSIIKTLVNFKFPFVLLAPTGRAAKVLANYCQQNAFTIHKYIYRQLSADDFRFVLNYNNLKEGIFFVDEASLLSNESNEFNIFGSGRVLDDLLEFVFQHTKNKLVLIGDAAQLPPVGSNSHPALNPSTFNNIGFNNIYAEIKEVVRQQDSSNIYINATSIRKNIEEQITQIPILKQNNTDFEFISSSDSLEFIGSS